MPRRAASAAPGTSMSTLQYVYLCTGQTGETTPTPVGVPGQPLMVMPTCESGSGAWAIYDQSPTMTLELIHLVLALGLVLALAHGFMTGKQR